MTTEGNDPKQLKTPELITGLAMVGGLGMTLAVVGAAVGVSDPGADSQAIGALILGGIVMTLGAIVAWVLIAEPHKHFDDITQPLEDDHHGHDDDH